MSCIFEYVLESSKVTTTYCKNSLKIFIGSLRPGMLTQGSSYIEIEKKRSIYSNKSINPLVIIKNKS